MSSDSTDGVSDAKKPGIGSILLGVVVVAIAIALFVVFKPPSAAGDRTKLDVPLTATQQQEADARTVSMAELEAADGLDGRPAWVAVNGVVYDVTNSPGWKDGEHRGGSKAGADLTEEFVESAHAMDTMSRTPVVGRLG